jgi:hypothetical protein
MAKHRTNQAKRDLKSAPAQTQAQEAKVAGLAVSSGQPTPTKGLIEVLSFMNRLSAFEKRSSQVNLLVR